MIPSISSAAASSLVSASPQVLAQAQAPAQAPAMDSATISPEGRALLEAEQAEAAT